MKFDPEAGKRPESAEDASSFENSAERMAEGLSLEAELDKSRKEGSELHAQIASKTTELLEASGKSDFKAVEALANEIAELNAKAAKNAAETTSLADRVMESKRVPAELADISEAEIDAMLEQVQPKKSELEEALDDMYKALEESAAERKAKEEAARADLAAVTDEDVDKAVEDIREKDEVEESLAEIQRMHKERMAEDEKKAKADEEEWMDVDISDLMPEEESLADEKDSAETKDLMDKWFAEGDAGLAADKERPVGTPDRKEVDKVLETGELSPERRAAMEVELSRLKNEVFDLVEGAEYTNLDGDPIVKPGLKELERTLKDMGIDMEQMAVSPWERTKAGFMGLFSRKAKRTMEEYRQRLEQFNEASENLELTKLQLADPKKYVAVMQRRWLRAMEARMRAKARSAQKHSGGPFTMKF